MYHYICASFENKGQTIRETLKSSLTFHRKEKVYITFDGSRIFHKAAELLYFTLAGTANLSHLKATSLLSNISFPDLMFG